MAYTATFGLQPKADVVVPRLSRQAGPDGHTPPDGAFAGYCQLNENWTLNRQFAWRESIDLSWISLPAPRVDGLYVVRTIWTQGLKY